MFFESARNPNQVLVKKIPINLEIKETNINNPWVTK